MAALFAGAVLTYRQSSGLAAGLVVAGIPFAAIALVLKVAISSKTPLSNDSSAIAEEEAAALGSKVGSKGSN
jgi:hypothetical protein